MLPADFAWHQSTVGELLRCPRRFKLRHVEGLAVDHVVSGFAAPLGTADHAAIEVALKAANDGREATRGELLDAAIEGFQGAVERAQRQGEHLDDEGVDRALDRVEGERLERVERLARDPRIHAVDWRGIEVPFDFREAGGRRWAGTIDAWGVAKHHVDRWGAEGRDFWFPLRAGEKVLGDWKTGDLTPLGRVERAANTQLGIYAMALNRTERGPFRLFIGQVADLATPKAPTDADGKRIPKNLPKRISPGYRNALLATGVAPGDIKNSRKRAKDADGNSIPKWLEPEPNPAYAAALERPKGPFIREVRVDWRVVLETVRAAVRLADERIFPASGALTGQCQRCPFSHVCTSNPERS